ncbi:MAG: hypothetical protein M1821_004236 [Bathelium mastoideum]|nr:MAG: hypothetical protein M1821_004236 [Bathelium mastoideum]
MFDEPYDHDCEKEIAVDIDFDRTGSLAKIFGPREHAVIGRAISYAEYKDVDCDDHAMKTDYQYSYVVCSAIEAESILAQALPHVPPVMSAKSDPHRVVVPIDIFVFCIRYCPTNTRHHMRLDEFLSHLATKTAVDVHFYTSEESAPMPQRFPAADVVTLFRQRDATPVNEQNPSVAIVSSIDTWLTATASRPSDVFGHGPSLPSIRTCWTTRARSNVGSGPSHRGNIRNKTIRFLSAPFNLLVTATRIPGPEELPLCPQHRDDWGGGCDVILIPKGRKMAVASDVPPYRMTHVELAFDNNTWFKQYWKYYKRHVSKEVGGSDRGPRDWGEDRASQHGRISHALHDDHGAPCGCATAPWIPQYGPSVIISTVKGLLNQYNKVCAELDLVQEGLGMKYSIAHATSMRVTKETPQYILDHHLSKISEVLQNDGGRPIKTTGLESHVIFTTSQSYRSQVEELLLEHFKECGIEEDESKFAYTFVKKAHRNKNIGSGVGLVRDRGQLAMTHFRDVRLRENGAYTFLHAHHIRSDGFSGITPDPQPQFDEGTTFRRASKIWPQTISFEPSAAIMRWYNEENNPMQWDADEESETEDARMEELRTIPHAVNAEERRTDQDPLDLLGPLTVEERRARDDRMGTGPDGGFVGFPHGG